MFAHISIADVVSVMGIVEPITKEAWLVVLVVGFLVGVFAPEKKK